MATFEKFPSIKRYADAVKQVTATANYNNTPLPTVTLFGTVKLHGTNAAVCSNRDEIWLQTRERIIPEGESHMGFREFTTRNSEALAGLLSDVSLQTKNDHVQIYGEWCGGNVQKGVGLVHLPKMFVVFAIGYGTGEDRQWLPVQSLGQFHVFSGGELRFVTEFRTWVIGVDFAQAAMATNFFVDVTNAVEADCPVARQLLGDDWNLHKLVGEGVVWTGPDGLRFKVKGAEHSASHVRTLAAVDEEKIKGIAEFVQYAVTENRLAQGIDKLREMGKDPALRESIGDYVKWVVGDVLREEAGVIAASMLEARELGGPLSRAASAYIKKWQSEQPVGV